MDIILEKKPKNPTIIQGFPGFGLVGTIATEFLIDHLKTEQIGKIWLDDLPAMVAIHEGKVVEPIGIFYNQEYNIVIVHGITAIQGMEWKVTDAVVNMAKDLKAKEIISLEGIGSTEPTAKTEAFFYSSNAKKAEQLKKSGAKPLKEGIIMGPTGILLLKAEKTMPVITIFSETHSQLPDSKAAAKIIEVLDSYLGLKVETKPLLEQAQKFEAKLKDIMVKSEVASEESKKKRLSYVG
jgi:uncharacterized protein